jgi:hypothetical protein
MSKRVRTRFEEFSFGSIRIDGITYEYDVVIDQGNIRKRNKKPSKKFRDTYGHTPLSVDEDIPWKCERLVRYRHRSIACHGRGEAGSSSPKNQIGHTSDG